MRFVLFILFSITSLTLLPGCWERNSAPDDLEQARIYVRQRDFLEAEKSYERYLRRNPNGDNRWEVWNQLVDMALDIRHNRNSAIELMEAMLLEYENDRKYLRQVRERLAGEYEQIRRFDRAIDLWKKILQDRNLPLDKRAVALRRIASVYQRNLDFDEAILSLGECISLDIPQAQKDICQYELANIYLIREELDRGIMELNSLLTKPGLDEELKVLATFMLADALEQKRQYSKALAMFESIRHVYPNSRVIESRIEYLKERKKIGSR